MINYQLIVGARVWGRVSLPLLLTIVQSSNILLWFVLIDRESQCNHNKTTPNC
jgi:hypothetical protein